MHLLRKNLLLAGILSVAMIGLFCSSSVSALGESSVVGAFSQTPSLLYNKTSEGETLWGHGGKGVIFADNNNLVGDNKQVKTAQRGQTLSYSIELETERYYDDNEAKPIIKYELGAMFSTGLEIDASSVVVKVGGQTIPSSDYIVNSVTRYDEVNMSSFRVSLDWANYTKNGGSYAFDSFKYAEGAPIELIFSARISENAPSEVYVKGEYAFAYIQDYSSYTNHYDGEAAFFSPEHTATALLDGALVIRKTDSSGHPLANAKFAIEGVKAMHIGGRYVYDPKGHYNEFTTNEDGMIVIIDMPFGEYKVKETDAPEGFRLDETTHLVQVQRSELSEVWYQRNRIGFNLGGMTYDCTNNSFKSPDGTIYFDGMPVFSESIDLTYDDATDAYLPESGGASVVKNGDTYIVRDNEGNTIYSLEKASYGDNLYKKVMTIRNSQGLNISISEIDEATIEVSNGYSDGRETIQKDSATGCYNSLSVFTNGVLCKQGDGYLMSAPGENGFEEFFMVFEYDDESGLYYYDPQVGQISFEIDENNNARLTTATTATYYEQYEKYFIIVMGPQVALSVTPFTDVVPAAQLSLVNYSTNGGAEPEGIVNPQTSDTAIKALVIASICVAPAYVLRRQLSKR